MKYLSTRDDSLKKSFNEILYQGLSKDGGLYLPVEWPTIDIDNLENKSYEDVSAIFKEFDVGHVVVVEKGIAVGCIERSTV